MVHGKRGSKGWNGNGPNPEQIKRAELALKARQFGIRDVRVSGSKGKGLLKHAPSKPVVDRITQALRATIMDGEIKFNRSGSAGWADEHHVYLVCRTAADLVRQRLASTGSRDVPHDNTRLFDLWQD